MKWSWSALIPLLLVAGVVAQEPAPGTPDLPPALPTPATPTPATPTLEIPNLPPSPAAPGTPNLPPSLPTPVGVPAAKPDNCWEPVCPGPWGGKGLSDRLAGTHKFDRFIGFLSNPLQNIDPRAVTEVWPVFSSTWATTVPALPDGEMQLYGAGLYLALSERLSLGMNQGGYAALHLSRGQPGPFADRFGVLRDRNEFAGNREGWLNLGGFVQYTLIANEEKQFLLTAGMRWEAPSGSQSVFQGRGPAHLAPYVTLGKEFGHYHVLATTGYEFPVGSGGANSEFFYTNVHLDRQTFGWLYPLVEFNWTYHTSSVDLDLPTRGGFFNFGNFSSSGNIVTVAVGANAVLVPSKLELGAVYSTPLHTERNFDFNGLLVKMVYRY